MLTSIRFTALIVLAWSAVRPARADLFPTLTVTLKADPYVTSTGNLLILRWVGLDTITGTNTPLNDGVSKSFQGVAHYDLGFLQSNDSNHWVFGGRETGTTINEATLRLDDTLLDSEPPNISMFSWIYRNIRLAGDQTLVRSGGTYTLTFSYFGGIDERLSALYGLAPPCLQFNPVGCSDPNTWYSTFTMTFTGADPPPDLSPDDFTKVGTFGGNVISGQIVSVAVPEPTSICLLATILFSCCLGLKCRPLGHKS